VREAEELARRAAAAGAVVLRRQGGAFGRVRVKSSRIDFVTDADVAAGVAAVQEILTHAPESRFVVEEGEVYKAAGATAAELTDDAVWVIDPLDGTTSFLHGYPCYSVSVAYLEWGVPKAGAVHNVPLDEVFTAASGSGATLDGLPISVGNASSVDDALLITGFPYDRTITLDRQLAIFQEFVREAHGIRRDGSAAVDCCHVASGRADAFWELGLQPWDTAAGVVILREAGAIVTDFTGAPWTVETSDVLAANPRLHEAMLERIRELDPARGNVPPTE